MEVNVDLPKFSARVYIALTATIDFRSQPLVSFVDHLTSDRDVAFAIKDIYCGTVGMSGEDHKQGS
jgi:hypothetical protein